MSRKKELRVIQSLENGLKSLPHYLLWHGDVEDFLDSIPQKPYFDLIVTSPPYNIGKEYENRTEFSEYLAWQERIIEKCVLRLKPTGSICWQIGNHIIKGNNGSKSFVLPLDMEFHPIFSSLNLKLRNRIIWKFGHGLHNKYRFSGRHEVILWYTKTDGYTFNLDEVRIPPKYPGKKHFKGPNKGEYSSNPLGKNPEDVWDIPNVKCNHIEKTLHPCQFPVALIERLILALTNTGDLVFDPLAGVGSTGVAAALNKRRFIGCEREKEYISVCKNRVDSAILGKAKIRPLNKPIYDHKRSNLSKSPER